MGKGSKNWETHAIADDQQQQPTEIGKRQFTWEEIHRHSTKNDRWFVINNRVYDVTNWKKHPGGQMVLNHYAGQDATVKIKNYFSSK